MCFKVIDRLMFLKGRCPKIVTKGFLTEKCCLKVTDQKCCEEIVSSTEKCLKKNFSTENAKKLVAEIF